MSANTNYFKLGVFVLCAIGILIAAIIVLSSGLLGSDAILLETYIDESVQGLSTSTFS